MCVSPLKLVCFSQFHSHLMSFLCLYEKHNSSFALIGLVICPKIQRESGPVSWIPENSEVRSAPQWATWASGSCAERYTIGKWERIDGDRHSQVRWRFVTCHDQPRLMGVASHRSFPDGMDWTLLSKPFQNAHFRTRDLLWKCHGQSTLCTTDGHPLLHRESGQNAYMLKVFRAAV